MSDASVDAARASGNYPPKGYGWMSDETQRALVVRHIAAANPPRWARAQAVHRFKLEVPLHPEIEARIANLDRGAAEAVIRVTRTRYAGALSDYSLADLRQAVRRLAQLGDVELDDIPPANRPGQ